MFESIIKNCTTRFNNALAKKSAKEVERFGQRLLKAVESNDISKVKSILKACPQCTEVRGKFFNYTALTWASSAGYNDIAKELIAIGADIDATDKNGGSPVKYAAANNRLEVLKELINAGAKLDRKNVNGYTALISAAERGHAKVVKLLLAAGADIKITTRYGDTAMQRAKAAGHRDCVELLKSAERNYRPTCEEVDILPPMFRVTKYIIGEHTNKMPSLHSSINRLAS